MTLAILGVLKALPILIQLLANIWEYLQRVSHGRPDQLLAELYAISEDLKGAKSYEERSSVARRIAMLWADGGRMSELNPTNKPKES